MPIYEYRCPNGHTFELFQRFTDLPAETCEVCGASPVTKVLYPAAVHFKGSGFYSTDYGNKRKRSEGGESSTTSTSTDGGSKTEKSTPPAKSSDSSS